MDNSDQQTRTAEALDDVGIVIVLYNPDVERTYKQLAVLSKYCPFEVIFIDNSPSPERFEFDHYRKKIKNLTYKPLYKNVGIAQAQNIGIKALIKTVQYILLLDQDSLPDEEMLPNLRNALKLLLSRNFPIAAIGPVTTDEASGEACKPTLAGELELPGFPNLLIRREIIASGKLIPVQCLSSIGMMEEELFIDGVDHEWCWRAQARCGMKVAVLTTAIMQHTVGEGMRRFLFLRYRVPAPKRTFYQIRNYVKLAKRSYVPKQWKITTPLKYCIKFPILCLFQKHSAQYRVNIKEGLAAAACEIIHPKKQHEKS